MRTLCMLTRGHFRTQGQVSVPLNNNSAKCGLMNEPEGTKRSFS